MTVFACPPYECESCIEFFAVGTAGLLGNVLNAVYIAILALASFIFFGEVMTPVETVGAALIAGAVIFITGVKAWRKKRNRKYERIDGDIVEAIDNKNAGDGNDEHQPLLIS